MPTGNPNAPKPRGDTTRCDDGERTATTRTANLGVTSAEPVTLATVKPPRDLRTNMRAVDELKECTNG